jgi:hypothetical protein
MATTTARSFLVPLLVRYAAFLKLVQPTHDLPFVVGLGTFEIAKASEERT